MKTFYLYIVLLLSLGCKAQEFDLRGMKRFDEKVFKDWEVDTSFSSIPNTKFLKKGNAHSTIKCNFLNCFLIEQVFRFFKH